MAPSLPLFRGGRVSYEQPLKCDPPGSHDPASEKFSFFFLLNGRNEISNCAIGSFPTGRSVAYCSAGRNVCIGGWRSGTATSLTGRFILALDLSSVNCLFKGQSMKLSFFFILQLRRIVRPDRSHAAATSSTKPTVCLRTSGATKWSTVSTEPTKPTAVSYYFLLLTPPHSALPRRLLLIPSAVHSFPPKNGKKSHVTTPLPITCRGRHHVTNPSARNSRSADIFFCV